MNILMILTSHERLGDTGRKTGVSLESFVIPYFLLRDAGADLALASPAGGQPPIEPASCPIDFPAAARFAEDECGRAALADTLALRDVYADDFDAAFYSGGFGCYWDLATDMTSAKLIADLHAAGKPIALVAQAVAALGPAYSANGRALVDGRHITGFSDQAAAVAGMTDILPISLEKSLGLQGALYRSGPDPRRHVLQDGLLITGETVATSEAVARILLQTITRRTDTQSH